MLELEELELEELDDELELPEDVELEPPHAANNEESKNTASEPPILRAPPGLVNVILSALKIR